MGDLADVLSRVLRRGVRTLRASPGLTAVLIVSLALGIGGNVAVFSVLDELLRAPTAGIPDASTLISLMVEEPASGVRLPLSYPDLQDLRARQVFDDVAGFGLLHLFLDGSRAEPEGLDAHLVTPNYFRVLGLAPHLGTLDLGEPGESTVVVLSFRLWVRRFAAEPSVVGRRVELDGQPFVVAGVAPRGFDGTLGLAPAEIWLPLEAFASLRTGDSSRLTDRGAAWLHGIGRVRGDKGLASLGAELETVSRQLEKAYPGERQGGPFTALPLAQAAYGAGGRERMVYIGGVLLGITGLVFLVACFNIAGVLLARAHQRQDELALRLALGARRRDLIGEQLVEGATLAVPAGLVSLVFAAGASRALWAVRPPFLPTAALGGFLDGRVLAITGLLLAFAAVLSGAISAAGLRRVVALSRWRSGPAGADTGRTRQRLRKGLVAVQLALSLMVLALAGLLLRSLGAARDVDLGIDTSNVLFVNLEQKAWMEPLDEGSLTGLLSDLAGLSGVESATVTSRIPLSFTGVEVEEVLLPEAGRTPEESTVMALVTEVGERYLETLRVPLLGGHPIPPGGDPRAVLINRELAHRLWPGGDPVGRSFLIKSDPEAPYTVAGWVENSRYITPWEKPRPAYFIAWQPPASGISLVVRTTVPPRSLLAPLRRRLVEGQPSLQLVDALSGDELVGQSLWALRLVASLLTAFGLLAVTLAAVGVYGVAAHSVGGREREVGIRLSLGARRGEILWSILRSESGFAVWGLGVGLLLAVAAKGLFRALLFGGRGGDPLVFGAALLLLLALTLLAQGLTLARLLRRPPTRLLHGRDL